MVKPHGRLHSHIGRWHCGRALSVLCGLTLWPLATGSRLLSQQEVGTTAEVPSQNIGISSGHQLQEVVHTDYPCIKPAIEDFPDDFFSQEERQRGGVLIHLLLLSYTCVALAIVCDRYFVPSLQIISNYFRVPTDVAGATFMAIGTSAPELYSSVIGAFVTEGDIGVGAVVGSAVFNLLFVTGMAGLVVWKKDVPIDWYPISRDCIVYTVAVGALVLVICNKAVTWVESSMLLLLFLMYVLILCFNTRIEGFSTIQVKKLKAKWTAFRNMMVEPITLPENPNEKTPLLYHVVIPIIIEPPSEVTREEDNKQESSKSEEQLVVERRSRRESQIMMDSVQVMAEDNQEVASLWSMPTSGAFQQIWWVLSWPVCFIFYLTIPDCRRPNLRMLSALTFLLSVVWIGVLSYVCVWMVTIIGYTLNMPDSVSGITILAAGTSMPEIISSVIVVRNGLGNMAICNLIGSNIFDILFCLGLPWLIKTLVSGTIIINSAAMTYTSIMLLSNIVLLYFIFIAARWKLNWKVGISSILLYAAFITLACLYELNVFGPMNPPACPS